MINWRNIPFVRITLAFMLGIYLSDKYLIEDFLLLSVGFTLFFILIITKFLVKNLLDNYFSSTILLCLYVCLGVLCTNFNTIYYQSNHYSNFLVENDENRFVGTILEAPKVRNSAKTDIEIDSICAYGKCWKSNGLILTYFEKVDSAAVSYQPGDMIYFFGKASKVRPNGNPSTFDFKSYLHYRGIEYQIFIAKENHSLIAKEQLPFYLQYAMNARNAMMKIYEKYLPDKDELAIATAMILGFRNNVSDELYQAFSDSGSVHILAVSGLHVGILATVLMFVLNKLMTGKRQGKYIKAAVVLFSIWFFTFLTGTAPAIVRAAIMFSIILAGDLYTKEQNLYNVLSACALGMLVLDPYLMFQASFQFSFMALLSLVFFQPYFYKLWLPPNWVLDQAWKLATAAISAQILVFPITIFFFHKFPVYFILSGVFSVAISTVALILGLILVLIEFTIPFLNLMVAPIFKITVKLFIKSVVLLKELPGSSIDGLWINDFEMIIMYIGLAALMYFLAKRHMKAAIAITVCWIILCISVGYRYHTYNHQSKLILYDVIGGSVFDIFDGREVFSFVYKTSEKLDVNFLALNHRYAHGITKVNQVSVDSLFSNIKLTCHSDGLIELADKKLYIIDRKEVDGSLVKMADYILVVNESKFNPEKLNLGDLKKIKKIVIDKSIRKYIVEKWKKYADLHNIPYHVVYGDGAFELN